MIWIIDQLIAFLTDLRADPLISQLLTIAGIPTVIAIIFGFPAWVMTRKVRESVTTFNALEARLKTANSEAAKLETEVAQLKAETPRTFVTQHKRETRDGNDPTAMKLAENFIDRQKEALLLAFRSRMDEAIRQSVEDGAAAFERARSWGRAVLALEPDDQMLRMLLDDLSDAAEIAAASKAGVKLKGDKARKERAASYERLPTGLDDLTTAFYTARARGHYALMLFLTDHGLMLTRRRPFGEGSREHLLFRRHRAEALFYVGRARDALDEMAPLVSEFSRSFGAKSEQYFSTRYLLASCRQETGDAAGALSELEDLLPLRTEVQGARHPHVLSTRILRASCLLDLENRAAAAVETEGVRDDLIAAKLRPEHRYFRRLAEVEKRITE